MYKDILVTKDNGTTHRLINSDFLLVNDLPVFDAVITDTPFGTTKCKWDSVVPLEDYIVIKGKHYTQDEYLHYRLSRGISYTICLDEWSRVSSKGMWSWLKPITHERTPILLFSQLPYDKVLGGSNLKGLKYEWVWEKTSATGHLNAKKMPMKCHENILTFYGKLPVYNYEKTRGNKPTNSFTKRNGDGECYGKTVEVSGGGSTERYPRDILKFASDKQKINLNRTQKPLALLRYLIRTYTNTGDTVLDFTAGSMSLAVACYLEGRNSVCIEMNTEQYEKSIKWVKNCSLDNPYNKDVAEPLKGDNVE